MFKFFELFSAVGGGHPGWGKRSRSKYEVEYTAFLNNPAASAVKAEVERLNISGGTASTYPFPLSGDTALELAIFRLVRSNEVIDPLPVKLLSLLVKRLELACARFEPSTRVQFLRGSVPALESVLLMDPLMVGVVLLDLGIDKHIRNILEFLSRSLMELKMPCPSLADSSPDVSVVQVLHSNEATVVRSDGVGEQKAGDNGVSSVDNACPGDRGGDTINMFHSTLLAALVDVLRVLKILYVGSSPPNELPVRATGSSDRFGDATGFSCSQLAKGWTRPQAGSLYAAVQKRSCPFVERRKRMTKGATRFNSTSEAILVECSVLCRYCSEVAACVAAENSEEEEVMVSEILCGLPIVMLNLLWKPTECVVKTSLGGLAALLSRFAAVGRSRNYELRTLQQISCNLLLVSRLLRENPSMVIGMMASAKLFDSLVLTLEVVGARYECMTYGEECTKAREECMSELRFLVAAGEADVCSCSGNISKLREPNFDRLSGEEAVDEFLHCYLGFQETQREGRRMMEVRGDPLKSRFFTQMELSPLTVLLQSAGLLPHTSCLYGLMIKYAVNSLPPVGAAAQDQWRVETTSALVNAGLYNVFFYEESFITFRKDPRLQHAALYLLHRRLNTLREQREGSEDIGNIDTEVAVILDVLCCRLSAEPFPELEINASVSSGDADTTGRALEEVVKQDGLLEVPLLLCVVLFSASCGPNGDTVVGALIRTGGVSRLARLVREHISPGDNMVKKASESVGMCVIRFVMWLLRRPDVQANILANEGNVYLSLLSDKIMRPYAEEMLHLLFTHSCNDDGEYMRRMEPMVDRTWEILSKYAHLESGSTADCEDEEMFLSILNCVSDSLSSLRKDVSGWGAMRRLQNALCGGRESVTDVFLRLFHRTVLPWCVVEPCCGLSSIMRAVIMLVQGNPPLRTALIRDIGPEHLVETFRTAWFASSGGSWLHFMRCMLSLVYEDEKDLGLVTQVDMGTGKLDTPGAVGDLAGSSSPARKERLPVIQNPALLLPLLRLFLGVSEFTEEQRDAMQYILERLSQDFKHSRASIWMVANAGVFEALSALIPVVDGTPLLESVLTLITAVSSHHVTVRETKQFLTGIAHARSEEERRLLARIVIEVLSAASRSLLDYHMEQQNYIAFRQYSGQTGLKVVFNDFPRDAYTLCLWIRLESPSERCAQQCVYSLQGAEEHTTLELVIGADGRVRVLHEVEPNKMVETDVGCTIQKETWTHLAVVHSQNKFSFTSGEFTLFINGVEVNTIFSVKYPQLSSVLFYVATCGEDIKERSYKSSFVGQVAALHLFIGTLSAKLIQELSEDKMGGENVRNCCSSLVAVYVDPRFGECGQLHNMAAVLHGKETERPLITYEGTLSCDTRSIVDSICVLGALQAVVIPLLVLLINPQLPFSCRVPVARRRPAPKATRKAMSDLLKFVEALLRRCVVRADVLEMGLFPMISHALQQFSEYDCTELPQRFHDICVALVDDGALFDAAFSSLFLSADLLHICTEQTQVLLVQAQCVLCSNSPVARCRVRGLDLPHFVVNQIIQTYDGVSEHHNKMRDEFFHLLGAVMEDNVTMNDADAVQRLVRLMLHKQESHKQVLLQTLRRARILIAERNPNLAAYLGKKDFTKDLIPVLNNPQPEIRNEALLLFILLASRSRKTQELLNPALLTSHEAVHVMCDVSLSWIRDKLDDAAVDVSVYKTLRAALTGKFNIPLDQDVEVTAEDKILFPPVLTPLILLLKRSSNRVMKENALKDIATLMQQHSAAWKGIVSVPGWYASLADLYLSEGETVETQKSGKSLFMAMTAFVFSRTIFQALVQEAYGASELELIVTYLFQRRAHVLLNAILIGVVKEFIVLLKNRRDDESVGGLSLGNQVLLVNLTALVSVVEDVLFYSVTAYVDRGVSRSADAHRKRGYTEEEELLVYTAEDYEKPMQQGLGEEQSQWGSSHCDYMLQKGVSFLSGDTTQLRTAPDGVWLHLPLAVHTMQLLTTNAALLNSGGTWSAGATAGITTTSIGPSADSVAQGVPPRKGGFLRVFVRLFRVTCSFTLRDATQLDDILALSRRWVEVVDNDNGPFAALKRQWKEVKEHSALSSSMTLILSLHELLNRRLRFSLLGPSTRHSDVNCEILDCIKSICVFHKKDLIQMHIFGRQVSPDFCGQTVKECTLDWLCGMSAQDCVREFVEVASRQDYDSFISQCILAMERDQLTDKGMSRTIEQYHGKIMTRLHSVLTDLSVSRRTMLDVLEHHLHDDATEDGEDKSFGAEPSPEHFTPFVAKEVAVFNICWSRFLWLCKGSIWDVDPAGQHTTKYVRLQDVEQKMLLRRKFEFDPNGTNHANITVMGVAPSDAQAGQSQLLRLRGGEHMLFTPDDPVDDDDEASEAEPIMEDVSSVTALNANKDTKPIVRFSIPCEVPCLMHCWSATLMIRDCELCIFFDEENTAYNQRVADGAASLIIKPRDIIYHSGHIARLAPGRRFRMQRSAAEIWFRDGRSVLLNFASVTDMRNVVSRICVSVGHNKAPHHSFYLFNEVPRKEALLSYRTSQWRDRRISNFEYLIWLNFFGGRTLNDLTQYPVFPWVIADYKSEHLDLEDPLTFRDLSLPIGVCNGPQSRKHVEMRYEEMRQTGDVPAHYFSHYSSPAVVLYYMIRVEPFTTLQVILQDGHFDHADRMFHSLSSCWNSVLTNSQDVRELIPELFYLPELCMNSNKVRFGCRQDGRPMDALELPPWAHGDPYEFVYRMREALESDYVSLNLHHWIDLIFGYKQRGKDAISALNVFNWHSYEDLDKNHTGNVDQKLLIDSLDNIGQTPIQLFTKPHGERCAVEWVDPLRCTLDMKTVAIHAFCARVARVAILDHERVLVMCGNGTILLYRLLVSPVMRRVERSLNAHRAASSPTCNANSANANGSFSGKHSTGAAVSSVVAQASSYLLGMVSGTASSVSPRELADNTAFQRPSLDIVEEFEQRVPPLPLGMIPNTDEKSGGPCETENMAVLSLGNEVFVAIGGLFDNSIMIRHLTSTIAIPDERLHAHYDRVVLVAASADSKYLVSGAEDTTFIVWSCHYQRQMEKLCIELLFAVYGHEDNPTAVSVCPAVDIVATASRDGVLMLHSLSNCRLERSLRHPSRFSIDRVLIQASCYLPNILYTSAVDNVIHQVSINGVTLRSVAAPGRITGWCTTPKQSLLITTAPLTNTSASEEGCGMLHFMHAFYLNVVKSVQCPLFTPGDTLATCAVHALNPQIVVCGSAHGTLSLLRLVSPPE